MARKPVVSKKGVATRAGNRKAGGYIGAVGGGYKASKPATKAETKKWAGKAAKKGLIPRTFRVAGTKTTLSNRRTRKGVK